MLEKYIQPIYTSTYTEILNNLVLVPFKYLQRILSEESFKVIADILLPVFKIGMVLYLIYILLSILQFLFKLIFNGKFKLNILISTLISIFLLYTFYVAFKYLESF